MFTRIKEGAGEFLGHLTGRMPSDLRDIERVREPFKEGETVRVIEDGGPWTLLETPFGKWGAMPGMREMLEKYPDAMMPSDVARELFKDAPQDQMKELDIGEDKLRYYAFHAVRI